MTLISLGRLEEAEQLQTSLLGSQLKSSWKSTLDLFTTGELTNPPMRHPVCTSELLVGYRGMIAYYEWKKLLTKRNRPIGDIDDVESLQEIRFFEDSWSTLQLVQSESTVNDAAMKAARLLAEPIRRIPNCEMFLVKLCEILYSIGAVEELAEVLEVYHRRNPKNICGIEQIYRYGTPQDFRNVSVLEELARLSPGHPLVLELCKMKLSRLGEPQDQFYLEILNLYGEYLDYRRNKCDLRGWQDFAYALESTVQAELHDCLMDFGKKRKSYWRNYHFQLGIAGDLSDLDKVKLSVWKILEVFW